MANLEYLVKRHKWKVFLVVGILSVIGIDILQSPSVAPAQELDGLQHHLQTVEKKLNTLSNADDFVEFVRHNDMFRNAQVDMRNDSIMETIRSLPIEYTLHISPHTIWTKQFGRNTYEILLPYTDSEGLYLREELFPKDSQYSYKVRSDAAYMNFDPNRLYDFFEVSGWNSKRWLSYFLGFTYLLLFLTLIIGFTYAFMRDPNKPVVYIVGLLVLPAFFYLSHFFEREIFIQFESVSTHGLAPIGTLLSSLCLFCISTLFYHHSWFGSFLDSDKFLKIRKVFLPFLFVLPLVALAYGVWTSKDLCFDNIEVDQIFFSSLSGLILLTSFSLILFGIFIFQSKLYKKIIRDIPQISHRLMIMGAVVAIMAVPMMSLSLPWFQSVLALFAYLLFFDLSSESPQLSITWLIWWFIMLGSFFTIILFKNINSVKQERLFESLEDQYHKVDHTKLEKVRRFNQLIRTADISSLANVPFPSKIESYDLISFLDTKGIQFNKQFPNVEYHVILLDKYGRSLVNASELDIQGFKKRLFESDSVSASMFHNPYSDSYISTYPLGKSEHPGSPFQFFIEIKYTKEYDNKTVQIYKNGINFGELKPPFPSEIPKEETQSIVKLKNFALYLKPVDDGITLATLGENQNLLKPISLFSFIFVLMGILSMLLFFANSFVPFLHQSINLDFFKKSIKNRLQVSIILLIVFFFVLVIIVSVFYFYQLSVKNEKFKLVNQIELLGQDIEYTYESGLDITNWLQTSRSKYFNQEDYTLNVYNASGLLLTQGNDGRLSEDYDIHLATSEAPIRGVYLDNYQFGNQKYTMALSQLNVRGKRFYLQIIQDNLSSQWIGLNDYIGSIINVYVFLFLIAGSIAIFIANSITFPITIVGEKLRNLKLGKSNERLEYDGQDELGILIKEYNELLVKLDESANFIAKSERDMAWREMAKQVAHEIKNPLTPMKLSIQYLEKAMPADLEKAQVLIKRISHTLLEQVDNLTQIANEFSNYAKLPKGQNEKVILNEVVEAVHDLFRKRDDMDIYLNVPIEDVVVFADKNHLVRVLNNLLKNAIQAIPQEKRGKIALTLTTTHFDSIIEVKDNGVGIPDHMKSKIFTPNFTTKNSGTGLGLAISANMLESFDGKITFESEENKGTIFKVQIPLMRMSKINAPQVTVPLE